MRACSLVLVLAFVLGGCAHTRTQTLLSATHEDELASRPARVVLPAAYDAAHAYPLLLVLHGYAVDAAGIDLYFGASGLATSQQVIVVLPEGRMDEDGHRFWNASPACCDLAGTGVDDVAYLRGVVDRVIATHHVDEARVYVLGHSNGGFMAHRLACEASDRFVAIVSVAGSTFPTEAECGPVAAPVSVLQVHGTADDVILYEGATAAIAPFRAGYPGAEETVRRAAARLGCERPRDDAPRDLDASVTGAETRVRTYTDCAPGTSVALFTITGGGHVPRFTEGALPEVLGWLLARRR